MSLNESPSEKEGKPAPPEPASAPKSLNESPSEKEGKAMRSSASTRKRPPQ